jgi:hypothetical protein
MMASREAILEERKICAERGKGLLIQFLDVCLRSHQIGDVECCTGVGGMLKSKRSCQINRETLVQHQLCFMKTKNVEVYQEGECKCDDEVEFKEVITYLV